MLFIYHKKNNILFYDLKYKLYYSHVCISIESLCIHDIDRYTFRETHFGEIIAAVMDTMKLITDRLLELQKKYQEIVNNAAEAVKSITPQLKESFNKIVHVVVEMMNTTLNVTMHMLKALVAVINEHQKELKELATMAMELAQGIAKVIFKSASQIRKDVDEFVEMLTAQLKTLQIYELGKERYQELLKLQIPEGLLQSIDELSNIFKSMLPTEELRQLHTAVYDYIIKHVRRQKVSLNPIITLLLLSVNIT